MSNLPCHPCDIPEAHCPDYTEEEEIELTEDELEEKAYLERKRIWAMIEEDFPDKKEIQISLPQLQNAI
jgi:hypothetical protein